MNQTEVDQIVELIKDLDQDANIRSISLESATQEKSENAMSRL